MNKLFAGPFVGEFGWELFCWQGVLRRYVESKNFEKVTICGRSINRFLYEDFCDEYLEYEPQSYQPDSFMNRGETSNVPKPLENCVYIPHNHCLTHYTPSIVKGNSFWNPNIQQSFVKYGNKVKPEYILIHARNTNKVSTGIRNWSPSNFEKIVKHFDYKFASIGLKGASHHINGTLDLRGLDLKDLCDYMSSGKLIIGPSSGPMHLASLCGLKHLTWGVENNINRYKYDWNPLNTEIEYIVSDEWDPSISKVIEKMEKML